MLLALLRQTFYQPKQIICWEIFWEGGNQISKFSSHFLGGSKILAWGDMARKLAWVGRGPVGYRGEKSFTC